MNNITQSTYVFDPANAGPGLIVLDGPDAVGKTTLAEQILSLRHESLRSYIHLTYIKDPREMFREQYRSLWRASLEISQGKTVVIDRHWMSDNIYASVYRGGTTLCNESRGWDRVMRRLCAIQVVCAPLPERAVEMHRAMVDGGREEMYGADDRIARIASLYRQLYFREDNLMAPDESYVHQLIRTGTFFGREDTALYDRDVEGMDPLRFILQLYRRLGKRREQQLPGMLEHARANALGHIKEARILFVGEQLYSRKSGRWPLIDYKSSSGLLSSCLHELAFDETLAMWTNALSEDNHLEEILKTKPSLKIIALGNKAANALIKMGIQNFHPCYHPSWALRFNQRPALLNQLKNLL